MRRILRALALVTITTTVIPVVTATAVLASFLFLPLPATLPKETRAVEALISRVYDIHGNPIGVFRRFDFTQRITPDDIPLVLKQAVIAAEDRRFYQHGGVDVRGTLRALWADVRNRQAVQGGSTITQQYVKNAYVGSERSLARKIREAIIASQLDRQVDKDEILFRYLERVYLGEGAYGVGAAAETYFRKSVRDLSLSEAALLAGLIPAPSRYEPRGNPDLAERKRLIVLQTMLREGYITQEQHDEAAAQRLFLTTFEQPPEGMPFTAVHPRERAETAFPYFLDYVERWLGRRLGDDAVYKQGLEIYTTLDPRLQAEAERSVRATLDGTGPPLEMALVALEPQSGYVKALVGGRDFYAPGGQVNLALGALGGGTGRQPGSTYKPFVLANALEKGVSPNKTYSGRNGICLTGGSDPYCPENYGGASYGTVTLRQATAKSINTVYTQLIRDVGVQDTMDLARRLGAESSVYREGFHGLSVALGAPETSPLEMASAYGTFAARGERAEPTPVVSVLDADGREIVNKREPTRERIIKEVTADTMNDVMRHVFDPGSTAGGRGIGRPAAGKTGTTQNNTDAWFVGYTPALSTAVWMGKRDEATPMGAVKGVRSVTGGSWPARTWQSFMQAALADVPVTDFTEPAPITRVADQAKRRARRGFDVGTRRTPAGTDHGGDYVEDVGPATVEPPPRSTTTTTEPDDDGFFGPPGGDDDDDDDDDDGFFG